MTNSIITQEQLEKILGSDAGEFSIAEVESVCVKLATVKADENSAAYHNIMDILRTASSRQEAAAAILEGVNALVKKKLAEVISELNRAADSKSGADQTPGTTKTLSPIFRRS